jgi:hypothetical protein
MSSAKTVEVKTSAAAVIERGGYVPTSAAPATPPGGPLVSVSIPQPKPAPSEATAAPAKK